MFRLNPCPRLLLVSFRLCVWRKPREMAGRGNPRFNNGGELLNNGRKLLDRVAFKTCRTSKTEFFCESMWSWVWWVGFGSLGSWSYSQEATINHLSTIKALQTTKIPKLNILSLLQLVFNRGWTISESKINPHSPAHRETIRLLMIWFFDLLPIRPLMYTRFSSPKTLHSLCQVPAVKTQLTFHSPDTLQHNFVLGFHTHSLEWHQFSRGLKPHNS